jgi:hypothetical protein
MNNQTLARGLFLLAISLTFGLWSLKYPIGHFSHAGAGLFPFMISCLLFVIGAITVIRSRFSASVKIEFNFKNITVVLASLVGFAVISEHLNMTAGIVFMVFCSTLAGTSYSLVRNVKISVGLVAIAFALQKLLGVNLPLF